MYMASKRENLRTEVDAVKPYECQLIYTLNFMTATCISEANPYPSLFVPSPTASLLPSPRLVG